MKPEPIYSEVHANWVACWELLRVVRCKESAKVLWRVADGEKDLVNGWSAVLATLWSTSHLSWHGCKMLLKQNGGRLHLPFTDIVWVSTSRQDEIQVLNHSRSCVWNCTQYGCFAFSKYSVLTLVIHGKCIQLNFSAAQAMTLPDFSHGSLFCCWVDYVDRTIFVLFHLNRPFYSLLYPTPWVSCLYIPVWFGERQQQPNIHVYLVLKVSLLSWFSNAWYSPI